MNKTLIIQTIYGSPDIWTVPFVKLYDWCSLLLFAPIINTSQIIKF